MDRVKIELQNVVKYYYSETAVTQALRKVNLQFRLGEFVAITGESGSGKSTLLKVISGMEPFDDGELYVDGEPTFQYDEDDWEEHRRHKIGFVFQDYSLIGHYSAKENIVSALLIMGVSQNEAEKKALEYLERVGLAKQCNQRASKLSSGQKQRLSIARALAKNTDIILADEPTGNLDSETGEQIIRLLQNLSKDHLIIMVTHNYEQVEHYITRKVRLHDGEVILDVSANNEEEGKTAEVDSGLTDDKKHDADVERGIQGNMHQEDAVSNNWDMTKKEQRKLNRRLARTFATLNARTQPSKVALFTIFFLITATVSFLFLGQIFMNADDVFTKEYLGESYAKKDSTRLSVRRKDGKELTEKDIAKMGKASHVVSVDPYDMVNDINYYYIEYEDYERDFGYSDYMSSDGVGVEYEIGDNWTSSIEFLNNKRFMRSTTSLRKEDLAEGNLPEGRNEIVLYDNGKTPLGSTIKIFFTNELLWSSDYIYQEMKVVGLLKEKTEQIYFSPDFCQMLQSSSTFGMLWYEYAWDIYTLSYLGQADLIPIVGEGLEDTEMRVSGKYIPVVRRGQSVPLRGQVGPLHIMAYDKNGNKNEVGEPIEDVRTREKANCHGSFIAEVSENMYDKYIRRESKQASVYITSYAKTDKVIRALSKQGYEAISTLRYGVGDYDSTLVQERLKLLAIAAVVLLVIWIAEILILRSLMKLRIKDQYVMKFMGMRMKLMCQIGYVEMRRYCVFAIVAVAIIVHALAFRMPMLREMLYYYEIPGYLLYFAYNMVAAMLMVAAFNHLLRGRMDE